MPYRKSYRRKRRPYKTRSRGLVRKVNRLQRTVGNKEHKFLDTTLDSVALVTTGTITQLSNLAQGLTDATRIGNKITVRGILLKYISDANVTTNSRYMLVQDKQTNGVIYANTDLLQSAAARLIIVSPRNADFKRRFKVWYDKTHSFSVAGSGSRYVTHFSKMNVPCRYDTNAGDITDVQTNSFSLMTMTETAGAAVIQHVFIRIYYTDS